MSDEKSRSRKEELDEFWNLEDLLPRQSKKVNTPNNAPSYKRAEPVEIISEQRNAISSASHPIADEAISFDTGRHYVLSDTAKKAHEPLLEYSPENSLIHSVKIYPWESKYNYYENFRSCAEKVFSVEGKECRFVPFFSYVPQYNQLNRDQLDFYFWWRSCVRRGEYIDTDYCYILLYVYETINLSGEHDYLELQDKLFGVWMAYRDRYSRLDDLLGEWIFDFSLIHRLPPPKGKIPVGAIKKSCGTVEFYISAGGNDLDKYVIALLNYCTSYDYKKSKFYEGTNCAVYDRYIASVLRCALGYLSANGRVLDSIGYGDSRAVREAYTGALCSYQVKRKIEIEFCSFSRSHELRYLVGDIVKYAENIIRAYLGVKSRLSVYAVKPELCELISTHLKNALPPKVRVSEKRREESEFDKLYEPPKKVLSLSDAARIESESWETTKILVEAFEEVQKTDSGNVASVYEGVKEAPSKEIQDTSDTVPTDEGFKSALGELCDYLCALLNEDNLARRSVLTSLKLSEAVAVDRINEIAADVIGDIVIDGDEGNYYVIEDYLDQLRTELLDEGGENI